MYLGQASEATRKVDTQGRKVLALLVALVLVSIAFLLLAGEVRAKERHAPAEPAEVRATARLAGGEPTAAVADAGVSAPVAEAPVEAPPAVEEEAPPAASELPTEASPAAPAEELSAEAPSEEAPSAGSVSATVDYQDLGPVPPPEFVPDLMPLPELVAAPVYQPDSAPVAGPGLGSGLSGDPWFTPEVYLAPEPIVSGNAGEVSGSLGPLPGYAPKTQVPASPAGLAPVPEPGFEGNKPLLPGVQELPGPLPTAVPSSLLPGNGTNNAAQTKPASAPDEQKTPVPVPNVSKPPALVVPDVSKALLLTPGVSKTPPPVVPGAPARSVEWPRHLPSLGAAANSAVETLQSAATSAASLAAGVSEALAVGKSSPESSSAGAEDYPGDSTPPPSPSAPPTGGSSFSLSGGGQAGPGSVLPLLFCVLTSGLILLRRDGPLLLASYELPRLNSALLVPRERPG